MNQTKNNVEQYWNCPQRLENFVNDDHQVGQLDELSRERLQMFFPTHLIQETYPEKYIQMFLFIKLRSISRPECNLSRRFINQLVEVYNSKNFKGIIVSNNESEITSQIVGKIQEAIYISIEDLDNILEGCSLLCTNGIWILYQGKQFLKKSEISFALAFVCLHGKKQAFLPLVHKQKNHYGQIKFAQTVRGYIDYEEKTKIQEGLCQDPYSLRCSPQVYGVCIDALSNLERAIKAMINSFHFKYIDQNGKKIINLIRQSDSLSQALDFSICSLQEIGAISFLHSERIINSCQGKNNLQENKLYPKLLSMLKSGICATAKNKIHSQMGNFDTMCLDNFKGDVYFSTGAYFPKINDLMKNLYFILGLEILTCLQVIKEREISFKNKTIKTEFQKLQKSVDLKNHGEGLKFIESVWKME